MSEAEVSEAEAQERKMQVSCASWLSRRSFLRVFLIPFAILPAEVKNLKFAEDEGLSEETDVRASGGPGSWPH